MKNTSTMLISTCKISPLRGGYWAAGSAKEKGVNRNVSCQEYKYHPSKHVYNFTSSKRVLERGICQEEDKIGVYFL